jgi:uncharacterized membrane protein YuzA (DUF378 family)
MRKLRKLDKASTAVLIVGAANWGLVGLAKYDMVGRIFGRKSTPARAIYSIVGASALYKIGRAVAPKPKYEKRIQAFDEFMEKIDSYLQQAAEYKKQAAHYAPKMEEAKKRGLKNLRALQSR